VIRSAGSKSIDLISAIPGRYPGHIIFIEEKSTHKDRFYVSNKQETKDQYDTNRSLFIMYGLHIVYAVRYISSEKNKLWKIYEPDYEKDGYPVLKKDEGTLLEDWILKL